MQTKYKDDFMPCRPWGQEGDKKNDGYLISERHLFAVNGPHSLNQPRMIKKINSDFSGAIDYWEEFLINGLLYIIKILYLQRLIKSC